MTLRALADRARALTAPDRRALLGIAGAPGSGKSTLARRLQRELGPTSIVVPMDGFHLAKERLAELGRLDRMGAPDTFDAQGFIDLIDAIRSRPSSPVRAPRFDRRTESAVPDAITIEPSHRLAIVEGNYLLLEDGPWARLRDLIDEVWFIDADPADRLARLIARHVGYGKTPEAARDWSLGPDEDNATLIEATRDRADLLVASDWR